MAPRPKPSDQLPLPLAGLTELAVPLSPGQEKTFAVPSSWLGSPIERHLLHVIAAVKRTADAGQGQHARDIRNSLTADKEAVTQLIAAVIARRLTAAVQPTPRGRPISADACLTVARRLAENFLAEPTAFDKVARWVAVSVSAWAAEDRAASEGILARRIGYLIAAHADDTAGVLVELLRPPHRPAGYLEDLLRSPETAAGKNALPQIPPGTMIVLASGHFHDIREALYKNTFRRVEGTPWPTAQLKRNGASGYAQLRPAVMDSEPLLPHGRLQAWVTTMWRQQSELSDLDAVAGAFIDLHLADIDPEVLDVRQRLEHLGALLGFVAAAASLAAALRLETAHGEDLVDIGDGGIVGGARLVQ